LPLNAARGAGEWEFRKSPSSSGLGPKTGPGVVQRGQPTQIMFWY